LRNALLASLALVLVAASVSRAADGQTAYVFACDRENDLFRVVSKAIGTVQRFDKPSDAVRRAPNGAGVLVLADEYPQATAMVEPELLALATTKKLRLYVEYPSALPGLTLGKPVPGRVERAVVVSDFFGPKVAKHDLMSINGLHYIPVSVAKPHLVAARVAGFDTAVYGLPDKTHPLLFELPGRNVLVATTKLSHFVTGRYAPQGRWRNIWGTVLKWLQPKAELPPLRWKPVVSPSYGRKEALPDDHEMNAFRRGVAWFEKARMVIAPESESRVHAAANTGQIDALEADVPLGDGSRGSWEAALSQIHHDGSQTLGKAQRGDCITETAMAFAFGATLGRQERHSSVACNLLDYYLFESDARKKERGDPNHGAYGLSAWGVSSPAQYVANYGDDNARLMLATLATAALTEKDRWDEAVMMCLLGNLRTTGRLGFRTNRLDIPELTKNGWQPYFKRSLVNYAPHYEAYLWACYLWAYEQTGYDLFLKRAETALKMTMAQYTDGWRWTNGLAQEKARILLPLAWLVRVRDTPENRAMLDKVVDGLLALQDPCGAIREELGLPEKGKYPPPRTNAEYATNEASLIARNGDPVADLLYTTNFAFLGLHEAAAATGDERIIRAEDKLTEFLCRIQTRSEAAPSLDGGWLRAFDFRRWEHWGSNADVGWGAWCIESGWTQAWITSVLAMRQKGTSLWDLTKESRIERHFDKLRKRMLPDSVLEKLGDEAG